MGVKPRRDARKRPLRDEEIRSAIKTVHVVNTTDGWMVKKIAYPRVWRFANREEALDRARKLAKRPDYGVVVHDRGGRVSWAKRGVAIGKDAKLGHRRMSVPKLMVSK